MRRFIKTFSANIMLVHVLLLISKEDVYMASPQVGLGFLRFQQNPAICKCISTIIYY